MITVKNLTKRYGPHIAVDDVSFEVGSGEVVGFLGPNGAGKSTTMNILTGYLSSSEGDVLIDGDNILEKPEEIKAKIGYLPEHPPIYTEMTVREYLKFVCELKKVPRDLIKERIEYGLETVGIADVQKRLIGNLSKGYRQRVGLAQALMGSPQILILDEPTAGLDPNQIIEIRDLITELGKDHTVILSSHILPEVSAVCKRVMIMHLGRVVADGEPSNLAAGIFDSNQITLQVAGSEEQARKALEKLEHVKKLTVVAAAEPETTEVVLEPDRGQDIRRGIFNAMKSADLPILQMRTENMTLEEIFIHLTSGGKEAV